MWEAFSLLVTRDKINVNTKDNRQVRTLLLYTAKHGDKTVVRLLVAEDDVGVDTKDKYN